MSPSADTSNNKHHAGSRCVRRRQVLITVLFGVVVLILVNVVIIHPKSDSYYHYAFSSSAHDSFFPEQVVSNPSFNLKVLSDDLSSSTNNASLQEVEQQVVQDSKISCNEQNCLIENACFDRGNHTKKSLTIRLFGNESHVASLWKPLRGKRVIGFREANVIFSGMEGVENNSSTTSTSSTSSSTIIPSFVPSNSTASVVFRWVKNNCGHDLGDGAVAVFRTMRLFPKVPQRLSSLYIVGRKHKCDKVFEFMADNLVNVNYLNYKPASLQCFSRVYFGLRGVSYMVDNGTWKNREATLEADMRAFRDFYYRNAGVDPCVKRDTLLVMEKREGTHLAQLGNISEMVDYLRSEFPNYQVKRATWSDHTMAEQVHLMSRTRAMISLPGSDVMNGIFLQDGTPLVMYCRVFDVGKGVQFDPSVERTYWFDRVSYVDASTEACNSTNVAYWYDFNSSSKKSITYVDFESLKLKLQRLGIEPSSNKKLSPGPEWLSRSHMICPQELRQWEWEKSNRLAADNSTADSMRSEFRKKILTAVLEDKNKQLAGTAEELLKRSMAGNSSVFKDRKRTVFDDVIVSVELGSNLMESGDGNGQDKKAIVGSTLLQGLKENCVVYEAGIDYNDEYGIEMATKFGCSVHAFDCSLLDATRLEDYLERQGHIKNLAFHPWCLASEIAPASYKLEMYQLGDVQQDYFHTLDNITERLGHKDVDVMKFDIEGYEWDLLENIMRGKRLPMQIAFELHSRFSNPKFVPKQLVAGKGRAAVARLFYSLFLLGYRVVSKELNNGDRGCAEFVMYRFPELQSYV